MRRQRNVRSSLAMTIAFASVACGEDAQQGLPDAGQALDGGIQMGDGLPANATGCVSRWLLEPGVHPGATAMIKDGALVLSTWNSNEIASIAVSSSGRLEGDFDVAIRFLDLNGGEETYFSLTASLIPHAMASKPWVARAMVGTLPARMTNGLYVGGDLSRTDSLERHGIGSAGWFRFSRRRQVVTLSVALDGQTALEKTFPVATDPLRLAVSLFGLPPGPPLLVRIAGVESTSFAIADTFACDSLGGGGG